MVQAHDSQQNMQSCEVGPFSELVLRTLVRTSEAAEINHFQFGNASCISTMIIGFVQCFALSS